ncbi:hypothetical protein B1A_19292, partial [mine drainage metagenome]
GTHDSTDGVNLSLYLINGTYSYTASTSTPCFAGSPGFFIVQGAPITVRVGFSRATTPVTFDAVGLPTGTQWYVTLGGGLNASTRGTALTFNLTNGSYTYVVATSDRTYAPDPGSGEVVVQGALLDVEIRFAIVTSPVLVRETGLPNGTAWWIRTAGEQFTDNRTPMAVGLPNGTYRYSAGSANLSYRAGGGTFTVDGAPVDVNVSFRLVVFPVVIAQSGLSNGTRWAVVIDGRTLTSSNGTAEIDLPNGSYAFRLVAPAGYSATPAGGSVTVQGRA